MNGSGRLSPRQNDTLQRLLAAHSGIPRERIDGRVLRALVARQLAEEQRGTVYATRDARQANRVEPEKAASVRQPGEPHLPLSAAQQELLSLLCRKAEPLSEDEVDGRSARALISRGVARLTDAGLIVTPSGLEAHRGLSQPRAAGRKRGRPRKEHPRAAAIMRAVGVLEEVVPRDSELAVGAMFAHIDDVLYGFRRFARRLREGR
jgi:hypothetical protein